MGSLILLFVVTLSVIMIASYQEIRKKNTEMLKHYMELYSEKQQTESSEKAASMLQRENTAPDDAPGDPQMQPPPGGKPDGLQGSPPPDRGPDYQLSTFYSGAL